MRTKIMTLCYVVVIFSCKKYNDLPKTTYSMKYPIFSDTMDTIYFNQVKDNNITEYYFSNKMGRTGYYIQLDGYKTTLKRIYIDNVPYLEKRYYWSNKNELDSIDLYGIIDTTTTHVYISRLMNWKAGSKDNWFKFKYMPLTYGGSNDFIFTTQNTDKVLLVTYKGILPVNNKKFVLGIDKIKPGLYDDIIEIRFMSFLYTKNGEYMYMINPINVPTVSVEVKNKINKDYWVTF